MTFNELMRKGWSDEAPKESFADWKARMESEIEAKIISAPKVCNKLIHSLADDLKAKGLPSIEMISPNVLRKLENNQSYSSPSSRPATSWTAFEGECHICLRFRRLTRHHQTPREIAHLVPVPKGTALICRACHDAVHLEFTNMQLHDTDWNEVVRRVRVRLALVVTAG